MRPLYIYNLILILCLYLYQSLTLIIISYMSLRYGRPSGGYHSLKWFAIPCQVINKASVLARWPTSCLACIRITRWWPWLRVLGSVASSRLIGVTLTHIHIIIVSTTSWGIVIGNPEYNMGGLLCLLSACYSVSIVGTLTKYTSPATTWGLIWGSLLRSFDVLLQLLFLPLVLGYHSLSML